MLIASNHLNVLDRKNKYKVTTRFKRGILNQSNVIQRQNWLSLPSLTLTVYTILQFNMANILLNRRCLLHHDQKNLTRSTNIGRNQA
jgi:hypothetical protein